MEQQKNEPKVSIIIVNYNSSKLINDCIATVISHTMQTVYEIIIVDNSTENLKEVITYSSLPNVKLIQMNENVGFGLANNAGSEVAAGKYLFFLNPDTLLVNDAISILVEFMDAHLECGVCGGNLYDVGMSPTISFRRTAPGVFFELNELLHLIPEKLLYGKSRNFNYHPYPVKVSHISGADLMIRKELFEELQGFSKDFFMYYEETDLCKRVIGKGKAVYSVPEAKIIHLEGGTFTHPHNENRMRLTEQGRLTYYRRNHSRCHTCIGNIIYKWFLRSRLLLSKSPHKKEYFKLRLKVLNQCLN